MAYKKKIGSSSKLNVGTLNFWGLNKLENAAAAAAVSRLLFSSSSSTLSPLLACLPVHSFSVCQ